MKNGNLKTRSTNRAVRRNRNFSLKRISLALAMLFASAASAEEMGLQLRLTPELGNGKKIFQHPIGLLQFESRPQVDQKAHYQGNSTVEKIELRVFGTGGSADGVSRLKVVVNAYDKSGAMLNDGVFFTVENSGGRLDLNQATSSNLAAPALDQDKKTPGTQVWLENGAAQFVLIAPSTPQDVRLRVTAGNSVVEGIIPFDAELREMIAAGLVEGIIRIDKRRYDSSVTPARLNDGFEQQLRTWSRRFSDGSTEASARAAMFLKGKVLGSALLSMSYDSERPSRQQLSESIRPDVYYPVYGDSSVSGFDAVSAGKLFVRLDEGRDYVLYGDFGTSASFVDTNSSGIISGNGLSQLGNYQRTMTGVRAHHESQDLLLNAYASRDSLRQVVQELRANGTSGPFAVNSNNALENTERIEILHRDKNDLRRVIKVTPLQRWVDYSFEPFSGRILLARSLPSLDEWGNPQSLRVSYEVDQGGESFWMGGFDGQVKLNDSLAVGATLVNDKNPIAPYQLRSANVSARLAQNNVLFAELAHSDGHASSLVGMPQAGVSNLSDQSGNAARVEFMHESDDLRIRTWANRIDAEFNNPSAGVTANTRQYGTTAALKLAEKTRLQVDVRETQELDSAAKRNGMSLSLSYRLSEQIEVSGGIRHAEEHGRISGMFTDLAANPAPGSAFMPNANGGFTNQGNGLQNLNGVGMGANINSSVIPNLRSDTIFLGLKYTPDAWWTLSGLVENGLNDSGQRRAQLGARYQLSERSGIYMNAESQTGLASFYSLDPNRRSNTLSIGIDSSYMRGGNFFSEYRLRDATSGHEQQLASGVRNAWNISEGSVVTTSAERLTLLSGTPQKATAISASYDYTGADDWKGSARTEWRKLDTSSNTAELAASSQDSVLVTLAAAKKLNRDWTGLARNYMLAADNHGQRPNGFQNRFQLGFAYRPVDDSMLDVLTMLEQKNERNINGSDESRKVLVSSTQANFHPRRALWLSGRLALKDVNEVFTKIDGNAKDHYQASLIGGRLVYDLTENIDLGFAVSSLKSNKNAAHQFMSGVELGYLLRQNLWFSAGYNFSGFRDRDLSNDYTAKGVYFRLRFKFDQSVFNPRKFDNTQQSEK